jgi:hypothetical protein
MSDVRAAVPGAPIRCLLYPNAAGSSNPQPSLAIDVGKDAIWVIDPNTDALVTSAWLVLVSATPAAHMPGRNEMGVAIPVLVVRVRGVQPLTIGCPESPSSWRGDVYQGAAPAFVARGADWLALVEKFGLGPLLGSRRTAKANAAAETGRGRRLGVRAWLGVAFSTLLLLLAFVFTLGVSVGDVYGYYAGTPTRATITHCSTNSRGGEICTGTWSVGGVSHTGQIEAHAYYPAGSSLDVRVDRDLAYATPWRDWGFYVRILFGILSWRSGSQCWSGGPAGCCRCVGAVDARFRLPARRIGRRWRCPLCVVTVLLATALSTGCRPSGAAVGDRRPDPGTSPGVAKSASTAAGAPPCAPGSTPPLLVVPRQNE